MTDKDFEKIVELAVLDDIFVPSNVNAQELIANHTNGEIIPMQEVTARDVKFHNCYMSLIKAVWDEMPVTFKKNVPAEHFYKFLKHLKKNYRVIYRFKDDEKRLQVAEELKKRKKELKLTYKSIDKISEMLGLSDLVDYESISFGKMSEERFHEYIKEQLPWIYEAVIRRIYKDEDTVNSIIETIEKEYEKFLARL